MPSKTIAWRGPGLVAFGGPASPAHRLGEGQEAPLGPGGARKAAPCHLESFRALIDAGFFGRRPSTLTPSLSAVEKFFETGGGACVFLDEPRLGDPFSAWIGEDGGPGRRTGVYALSEIDEVGSIVLPPSRSPRRRELLLGLASRRPDLFFFLEELGMEASPSTSRQEPAAPPRASFPLRNVFLLESRQPSGPEDSRQQDAGLGALLGFLEASGFKEEAAFGDSSDGFSSAIPPPWLSRADALRLEAWRRWEGLRRSIDFGTRWTVFEVHHPLLWGRVEREIKAFLYRLQRLGLLASDLRSDLANDLANDLTNNLVNSSLENEPAGFWVECGPSERFSERRPERPLERPPARPSERDGSGSDERRGKIRIRVRARLSGPYSGLFDESRPVDRE